jgi:16S rRNA (cytidine1402-2'-O)-methyltransferase
VEPVPGPSAALAALSASGLPAEEFVFLGFPPIRGINREKFFDALGTEPRTAIVYEAPHRIRQTLTDLGRVAAGRRAAIGRELTKVHENLVVRPIDDIDAASEQERGEYTLVIEGAQSDEIGHSTYDETAIAGEYGTLVREGSTPRTAIRSLARKYGQPARTIYAAVHGLHSTAT